MNKKFKITFGKTYYNQPIINVPTRYNDLIADNESPVTVHTNDGYKFKGVIDRKNSSNGAPRLRNITGLKDWIQSSFRENDSTEIEILSKNSVKIYK